LKKSMTSMISPRPGALAGQLEQTADTAFFFDKGDAMAEQGSLFGRRQVRRARPRPPAGFCRSMGTFSFFITYSRPTSGLTTHPPGSWASTASMHPKQQPRHGRMVFRLSCPRFFRKHGVGDQRASHGDDVRLCSPLETGPPFPDFDSSHTHDGYGDNLFDGFGEMNKAAMFNIHGGNGQLPGPVYPRRDTQIIRTV
jgi:hypothetical protein